MTEREESDQLLPGRGQIQEENNQIRSKRGKIKSKRENAVSMDCLRIKGINTVVYKGKLDRQQVHSNFKV